jgi:hypothetical protein
LPASKTRFAAQVSWRFNFGGEVFIGLTNESSAMLLAVSSKRIAILTFTTPHTRNWKATSRSAIRRKPFEFGWQLLKRAVKKNVV